MKSKTHIFTSTHNLTLISSIIIIFLTVLVSSCSVFHNLPGENHNTIIEYRDSIVRVDSIIYTPVEVVKEIVPQFDTLKLETSLAEASAYVDTVFRVLRGNIQNKKGITEKIKYKDRIVYRDSISVKEVPYPVEVLKEVKSHFWYEKLLWFFAVFGLVCCGYWIIKLYMKFKI